MGVNEQIQAVYDTFSHCSRVANYCECLANELMLSEEMTNKAYIAGILHDTGKLYIEPKLLLKTEKLTSEDWERLKEHTGHSYKVVRGIGIEDREIIEGVTYHHERSDGNGYYSIKGAELSILSKIVHICDVYDALTSNRNYRITPKYSSQEALQKMKDDVGSFDQDIFKKFCKMVNKVGIVNHQVCC